MNWFRLLPTIAIIAGSVSALACEVSDFEGRYMIRNRSCKKYGNWIGKKPGAIRIEMPSETGKIEFQIANLSTDFDENGQPIFRVYRGIDQPRVFLNGFQLKPEQVSCKINGPTKLLEGSYINSSSGIYKIYKFSLIKDSQTGRIAGSFSYDPSYFNGDAIFCENLELELLPNP
jgi:hypothetical protein